MVTQRQSDAQVESEDWRELLVNGHRAHRMMRAAFLLLPGPPRCKMCNNPFGAVGGRLCKIAGFTPSRKNPQFCARCCERLPPGGATVDIGVLFADIRGSTALGESMGPASFAGEMSRFYGKTTSVLLDHGAIIDKLAGDGVMALFVRGIAGEEYRREACKAAVELQEAMAREGGFPLGVGVHVGDAYTGNVGAGSMVDFTALGDTVNTAARLQSVAEAGEVVFSTEAFRSVASSYPGSEPRTVPLKGKQEDFDVMVYRPESA